ncbi:MAG: prepilin-type N-terminal cleavage/methylation domain-containing protein [bacterium]|nr:prepilin-type N-terminal cleavage/methylation domain-containing protein [bacterium]
MLNKIIKNNFGTTLLEMLVAVALFSITILAATEIFQMVVEGQRNAVAGQNTQENMRYALEVMSKEMRMAQKSIGNECGPQLNGKVYNLQGSRLQFKNIYGECVEYQEQSLRFQIKRYPAGNPPGLTDYITPDEIEVSNLKFIVNDNVGSIQSSVTVKMDIEAVGKALHKSKIKIQTTISSRYYE